MSSWKPLLEQVITAALSHSSSKASLLVRTELYLGAVICICTAAGFITLGLYLWLWSLLGAIAAAFILALAFLAIGFALILFAKEAEKKKKKHSHGTDPALLAIAFLDGLLGLRSGSDETAKPEPEKPENSSKSSRPQS